MNWKHFSRSSRSQQRQKPWSRGRFRPRLDLLEDRTLLSTVTYTLDNTMSFLALSGMVGGQPIQAQGQGSLVTAYEGSLAVDIVPDDEGSTIQFLGNTLGDEATADNSGSWQPLPGGSPGKAPANYGAMVEFGGTALVALRGAQASAANASPVALTANDDGSLSFPSTQTLCIDAGTADYFHPSLGQGSTDISGMCAPNAASAGTVVGHGDGPSTIVVPIHVIINGNVGGVPFSLTVDGFLEGQGAAVPANTAETDTFRQNGANLPISATTTFFNPAWGAAAQAGRINTAEHELFHGIGFTVNYTNFNNHVRPANGDGRRPYTDDGTATGTLRALLTGTTTHVDPAAGTVNGFDQTTALMQPARVDATIRYTNRERDMLNDAFAWTGRNINIQVTFVGVFTADERTAVNTAAADAQTLFGSNGTGHRFDWTVQIRAAAPGRGAPDGGAGHWFAWTVNALPEATRAVLSGTHSLANAPLSSASTPLGDLGSLPPTVITTDLAGTPAAAFQTRESDLGDLLAPARNTGRLTPFDQLFALDAAFIDTVHADGMTF